MIETKIREKSIVTLLSSSAALSRRAQATLDELFGIAPFDTEIDSSAPPRTGFLNNKFHSLASKCSNSETILHFLSIQGSLDKEENQNLAVLSITGCSGSDAESIEESRASLVETMRKNWLKVVLKKSVGHKLEPSDIVGIGGGLPLLRAIDCASATSSTDDFLKEGKQGLKEITIPHFDNSLYPDGRSLLLTLSESSLTRPVVGLYQFQGGLTIRPLPAGTLDQVLPRPSLVFRCDNLEDNIKVLRNRGAITGKIGFNASRKGQVMVQHPYIPGLDLRLTETVAYSSSFPEAQEALLAGSLTELQNKNVLLEGGVENQEDAVPDLMNGVGDCWVEFRATMKQPLGFFKSRTKPSKPLKIAKAQDIPYE
mmetsp:Transcript_6811/g.9943  ORF Transcript_6811/g.9943 Transcript_6811/m.9943 type:complete len:369 (-) Transcript_6811:121-1227(-)